MLIEFPLDEWTCDKLKYIIKHSGAVGQRVVPFLLRLGIMTDIHKEVPENGYLSMKPDMWASIHNDNYFFVTVRLPRAWVSDMKDMAWAAQTKNCSHKHLGAYVLKLVLLKHQREYWVQLFDQQIDTIINLYSYLLGEEEWNQKKKLYSQEQMNLKKLLTTLTKK